MRPTGLRMLRATITTAYIMIIFLLVGFRSRNIIGRDLAHTLLTAAATTIIALMLLMPKR